LVATRPSETIRAELLYGSRQGGSVFTAIYQASEEPVPQSGEQGMIHASVIIPYTEKAMRGGYNALGLFACSWGFAQAASLFGIVVDAKTGAPIAGATVVLVLTKDPAGVPNAGYMYSGRLTGGIETDDSGHFLFPNLSPGVYRLDSRADDYCSPEIPIHDPYRVDTPFEVRAASPLPDATLRLFHCVEIRGRVTTPDGAPVPNVTLYLHPVDPGQEGSSEAKTDASGRYEFTGLWDGEYIMEAVPPIRLGDYPTALPISTRPGHVRVEYGDILSDIDFVLQPVPARTLRVKAITGYVTDSSDSSLEIRPILQAPTERANSVSIHSKKPGMFERTGLAPGRYFVEQRALVDDAAFAGGKVVEISAGENASEELTVLPIVSVSYVGRRLDGLSLPKGLCVILEDTEQHRGPFGHVCPSSETQREALRADVTFKMTVVQNGLYLDTILINGQPQDARAFQLPKGALRASMELVFGTGGKILIQPPAGVDVREIQANLLLFDGNSVSSGTIDFNNDNRLKIDGIPPGRHRLLVWLGDTPPCDLTVLSSCAGLGEWVTVQSGRTITITSPRMQ
jgi:protocatechuate 3,4-dioxygenase beta subunit